MCRALYIPWYEERKGRGGRGREGGSNTPNDEHGKRHDSMSIPHAHTHSQDRGVSRPGSQPAGRGRQGAPGAGAAARRRRREAGKAGG